MVSNDFSYDSLRKIAYDNNIPFSVTIELLTECNLRCKHCYIPNHDNDGLNTGAIIRILHELKELGTLSIILTGGEIFLRKDIFEIIEVARNLHFRVFLLSNATLLDEDKIKRLANLHISEFSVSVYSMKDSIHDSITKVSGSLKNTIDNVLIMKKYGIKVKFKTPLMKDNKLEYKELKEFCDKNGFEHEISHIITSKNNSDDSTHSLRVEQDDLMTILKDIDQPRVLDINFGIHDEICSIIYYNFYIDSQGDAYPCNSFFYKIGSIFESSIKDIWENSSQLKKVRSITRKDLKECTDCNLKSICNRCPGLALLEDNNLFGCSSVDKVTATVRHKILQVEGGTNDGIY